MSAFPPITELVPHTAPMLMLEEMLAWEDGFARTRLVLRSDGPFVRNGVVDALATLEVMAQGVAACLGMEAYCAGVEVRMGMVVACRRMDVERATLAVGEELVVEVRRVHGDHSTSSFEASTRDACGALVARARLTIVHGAALPGGRT